MSAHLGRSPRGRCSVPVDGWGRIGRTSGASCAARLRRGRRPSPDPSNARGARCLSRGSRGGRAVRSIVARLAIGQALGLFSIGMVLPLAISVTCAIAAPLMVQSSMRSTAPPSATTFATSCRRTSTSSRCCSPATSATRARFARPRRRATVGSSSNCADESSLPRRRIDRSCRRSAQLGDDLDLVELQQISASASLAASAGAPVATEPRGQVRDLAQRALGRAGDRRPSAHREDHRPARRHVAADHGRGRLPSPQLLSIGARMNIELMLSAITHVIYGQLRRLTSVDDTDRRPRRSRCRLAGAGAVVRRCRRRGRGDRRRSCGARSRQRPRSRSRRHRRREALTVIDDCRRSRSR